MAQPAVDRRASAIQESVNGSATRESVNGSATREWSLEAELGVLVELTAVSVAVEAEPR